MKNILHVNNTMNIGGIESFLLTTYSNIDLNNYKFYFLCYSNDKFDYEDDIKKLGGEIIRISNPKTVSRRCHYKELIKVMKSHKFDAVHCHTYFDSSLVLYAALRNKIKIRIAHSHTTEGNNKVGLKRKIKWNIARLLIKASANYKVACSMEAGRALFGNSDFTIVPNGIDMEKFKFNKEDRLTYRNNYNIKDDDIIIGHVGRFDPAKNHQFMIDLLKELKKKNNHYKLMLVGDGQTYKSMKAYVKKLNLENSVIFVGSVKETYHYYSAFDIFIFPSLYEGLGISLIESQANGLKILASTNIPREVNESKTIEFLPLDVNKWIEKITSGNLKRLNTEKYLENSKYNIKNTIDDLAKIYNN